MLTCNSPQSFFGQPFPHETHSVKTATKRSRTPTRIPISSDVFSLPSSEIVAGLTELFGLVLLVIEVVDGAEVMSEESLVVCD